ncbi:ferritin-like domain-containing protein [Pedobacter hartonius]|uniref:Ferritin-like domain-containing protein n=1 Tax=Pedobacter hartonius TaxID=425514 RepID=A0A1H3WK94_9SPHI|nr:ferritin-like domain-containing protein [Pedobacter hartonius]SDZ86628.1 Ferritin-like domain-containing protein [Pedobacter hartonius]
MNIINILDEIEKVDGEVYERLSPRRAAMKQFYSFGSKMAVAAVPLALGSMFKKAYGQSTSTVIDVLNFALTLEYLEYNFYQTGLTTAGLIPAGTPAVAAITTIRDHELAHVNLLKGAITASGGTPVAFTAANFDYTAKNTFPTVFSSYPTFLAVAQAFEDTGVRAYKGQAPSLMSAPDVLQTALQIHSVEARHASHIRQMRKAPAGGGVTALKPWITGANDSGVPQVDAVYKGEDNVVQAGVNIPSLGVSTAAATESFDEFLVKADVLAIASLFIKS